MKRLKKMIFQDVVHVKFRRLTHTKYASNVIISIILKICLLTDAAATYVINDAKAETVRPLAKDAGI